MDIVYACDNNYIEQTTISMVTLLKTNPNPVKFWIVHDGITVENQRLMLTKTEGYQREIEFLDIDHVLKDILINKTGRHPKTVYAKLFIGTLIDSDRVLYLDSDTVVTGSLEELWNKTMQEILIAGVQMPYSAKMKASMGIKAENPYLCDGIVMLNLQLWRAMNISEQCKAYILKHEGKPPMLSEGTLNYVCQDYAEVLNPAYNLMPSMILYSEKQIKKLFKVENYYSEYKLENARKNPIIIHYINELFNRPWMDPCDHPYKQFYRNEREKLFGKQPYELRNLTRRTRTTRLLKNVLPFPLYAGLYHLKHRGI